MKLLIFLLLSLLFAASFCDFTGFSREETRELKKLLRVFKEFSQKSELSQDFLKKFGDDDPDGDSKARFLISGAQILSFFIGFSIIF